MLMRTSGLYRNKARCKVFLMIFILYSVSFKTKLSLSALNCDIDVLPSWTGRNRRMGKKIAR